MEHLTKQQVTLLCLLVALFTSIATSVITASLMDKSSTGISQTIYRVVEKTIEQVAPKDSAVVRKIAEKENIPEPAKQLPLDKIVENAGGSVISIWNKTRNGRGSYQSAAAVIGSKNAIVAFNGSNISRNETYIALLPDGREIDVRRKEVSLTSGLALLTYLDETEVKQPLKGLTFSSLANQKLGSNVIALGVKDQNHVVSTGIIAEFSKTEGKTDAEDKTIVITDIHLSSLSSGWLLLDTSGNVIGFLVAGFEGDQGARYLDAEVIRQAGAEFF